MHLCGSGTAWLEARWAGQIAERNSIEIRHSRMWRTMRSSRPKNRSLCDEGARKECAFSRKLPLLLSFAIRLI
jgi:hypothetical protein